MRPQITGWNKIQLQGGLPAISLSLSENSWRAQRTSHFRRQNLCHFRRQISNWSLDWVYFVNFKHFLRNQYPLLRMDKRHTDFLIRISCNEKSVNLWREAFLPRGGLFSLGKNARGGISAWAKMPGEAFLPGGHFRLLHRTTWALESTTLYYNNHGVYIRSELSEEHVQLTWNATTFPSFRWISVD